ncbi:MAG TPA: sigma-70 family RNA polymerase sigma factor [bacterium]|nr:sigma-70 family RNA polymerase sigma factor [bacterium]
MSGEETAAPRPPHPEPDDREFVRRTLEGDDRAFAVLVRRYERGLYNLAYRMVHDAEQARDLTQEIFVRVHRSLSKYDPVYPFTSWIYRVGSNLCIDWIRKKKLKTVSLDAPIGPGDDDSRRRELPAPDQDPSEDLEQRERAAVLADVLAKLPESHRMILVLRHQRELSYEEISLSLEVPLGTVKARIHRAREAFRRILVRDHDPEDLIP